MGSGHGDGVGGETRTYYLEGVGNWEFVERSGQWGYDNAVDSRNAYTTFEVSRTALSEPAQFG